MNYVYYTLHPQREWESSHPTIVEFGELLGLLEARMANLLEIALLPIVDEELIAAIFINNDLASLGRVVDNR